MGGKHNQHITIKCKYCKNEITIVPSLKDKRVCCSRECMGKLISINRVGKNHPSYKGRTINAQGYVLINTGINKREYEHRVIMEKSMGRKLKRNEIIHHINGNKQDNTVKNLVIMNQCEHIKLHVNNTGNRHSIKTKEKISQSKIGSIPWNKGLKLIS